MSTTLLDEQRDLMKRVHRVVHWIKLAARYSGSKQTADFGGIVFAKLARNEKTRALLASEPGKLRGLVRMVAKQAFRDELRKRAAHGAGVTAPESAPELPPREQWTPSLHRETCNKLRIHLVREELAKFAAGVGSERVRARSRAKMVTAFELHYFEDRSQAEIAQLLEVSRNTIMEWIDCMTLHIGRRIAEREHDGGDDSDAEAMR